MPAVETQAGNEENRCDVMHLSHSAGLARVAPPHSRKLRRVASTATRLINEFNLLHKVYNA
jgi:hypothetical protein